MGTITEHVTWTENGVVKYAVAERDPAKYPATPPNETAFLNAIIARQITIELTDKDGNKTGAVIAAVLVTPTAAGLVLANPATFAPVVEWHNGFARVTDSTSTSAQHYYSYGGLPVPSLPTTYDLRPGDLVSIFKFIAGSSEQIEWASNDKSFAIIQIGPAPTS